MKWYNSLRESMTLADVIETECYERDNYTLDEINLWKENYGITEETEVMWVCSDKEFCKKFYCENEFEPFEIEVENIIEESDDGDNGFLAYWK